MSADKSDVTFVTGGWYRSTTYYNGDSNDPANIRYGPLWIWDEYGNHSVYYDDFFNLQIDGYSYYSPTYWFYGNMNSTNNIVQSEQGILKWSYGGWSSLGSDYNAYITQGS